MTEVEIKDEGVFLLTDGRYAIFPDLAKCFKISKFHFMGYSSKNYFIYNLFTQSVEHTKLLNGDEFIGTGNGFNFVTKNDMQITTQNNELLIFPKDCWPSETKSQSISLYNRAKKNTKIILLHKYQIEAVSKVMESFKSEINPICNLATGAGKTFIACEVIRRFRLSGRYRIMIIAKATNLHDSWEKDLTRFAFPIAVFHGTNRDNYLMGNQYEFGNSVIITSYETALVELDYLQTAEFDLIVFDELHTIINPKKLSQKVVGLSKITSRYRLALTATPIQNSVEDICLEYLFLCKPDILKSKHPSEDITKDDFLLQFKKWVSKNRILIQSKNDQEKKFNAKRIILSVPETREMIEFETRDEKIKHMLFQGQGLNYLKYLSDPNSIKYIARKNIKLRCTKKEAVSIILKNMKKDEKVIIFSRWIDVLNCYDKFLKNLGYEALIITGDDRNKELAQKIELFKTNDIFNIMLTTIYKSAEGLNLERANHIIILDFWWNPQKLFQGMGRIDRITQTKDIFIYLICDNVNGDIVEKEKNMLDTMLDKTNSAKQLNPYQMDFPEIQTFKDANCFKEEFQAFIEDFAPPQVQEQQKSQEAIANKESIKTNPPAEKFNHFYSRDLLMRLMIDIEQMNSPRRPTVFDDLDLTGR